MASCNSADNLSAVIEAVVMRTNRSARNTRILKTLLKRGQIIVDHETGKLYKPNGDDLYCRVSETGYVKCEARHRGRRLYFYAHKAVWLSAHGSIRRGHVIDHINFENAENSIHNLQTLTVLKNLQRRKQPLIPEEPPAF
jgi:hypothetical protein